MQAIFKATALAVMALVLGACASTTDTSSETASAEPRDRGEVTTGSNIPRRDRNALGGVKVVDKEAIENSMNKALPGMPAADRR